MTTYGNYKTQVTELVGASGFNYEIKLGRAVNTAQELLSIINWDFLKKTRSITTATGTVNYTLQDSAASYYDFGELSDKPLISDGSDTKEMIIMKSEDIDSNSLSNGFPSGYRISGTLDDGSGTTRPAIKFGYPTPDDNGGSDYTVTLPYFRRLVAMSSDSDVSEFSLVYENDGPIVYLATSILWQMLEDEQKAQFYLGQALLHITLMESYIPFSGKPFAENSRTKQWQQKTPA